MKVKDVMKEEVVAVGPGEPVTVAARSLAQYNVGILPVCRENGTLCGVITDRDLVTRCVAAGGNPERVMVKQVMTPQVISVHPDAELTSVATLMELKQVKRLPVVNSGKVCGMVSLSDLAKARETVMELSDLTSGIWANLTDGK